MKPSTLLHRVTKTLALPGLGEGALARAPSFAVWTEQFLHDRLKVVLWFGLAGNLNFILADYLFHPEQFPSLLAIRVVVQVILIGLLLLHNSGIGRRYSELLLLVEVWTLGFGIANMTGYLGGFTSDYYAGINLVLLGAAVIVPVQLRTHVAAQVGILVWYLLTNAHPGLSVSDWKEGAENGFFLLWTCILIDASVFLYARLQRAEFDIRSELVSTTESRERERLRNEFYANMNHELRTPLTLILGGFRALAQDGDVPARREIASTGLRNSSRLLNLINQMLDLARLDSGRSLPNKRTIDLALLVRQVASNFESSSDRRHIQLRGIDRAVPISVDVQQAKKVMYNLLSNAFKFSDPQSGQVWIRLKVTEQIVELQIEDNGVGIPQDQLDRIFGRFARVKEPGADRVEGTGIGLALVKEIVTGHGGTIQVESEVGQGTTFTLRLPQGDISGGVEDIRTDEQEEMVDFLYRMAQSRQRTLPPVQDGHADPGSVPQVLVVEDNPDLREYLTRLLSEGYRVVTASNGVEGLEAARRCKPDLILSDAMMPVRTGRELLDDLRADPDLKNTPVIFLTAQASVGARVESLTAGADDYLTKPFVEEELLARVRNQLRLRAQEQELRKLNRQLEVRIEDQMVHLAATGTLSRFLPQALVDSVLQGTISGADQFERRKVTVLFVDMVGFTLLTDHLEPEDLYALLNQYLREMTATATDHGGAVDKFIGDALMVLFGGADAMSEEKQAISAVLAALKMREQVAALAQVWHRRGIQEELAVRVGINTGYCTVGVFGSDILRSFTAVGSPINIASRLQARGERGEILCGFPTVALLGDRVRVDSLGALELRGVGHPIEAYRVLGLAEPTSPS